jgi:hypothetical protein
METNKMLMLGGAAGALWYFYIRKPDPTTAAPAKTPAGAPAGGTAPAAGPSLDTLYGQLVAAVGAAHVPGDNAGPDEYDALLGQVYPPLAGVLPDPNQLFAGTGWARPSGMPVAAYWSKMAPWLKTNKGLSGVGLYGLGIFGSLCCGLGAR